MCGRSICVGSVGRNPPGQYEIVDPLRRMPRLHWIIRSRHHRLGRGVLLAPKLQSETFGLPPYMAACLKAYRSLKVQRDTTRPWSSPSRRRVASRPLSTFSLVRRTARMLRLVHALACVATDAFAARVLRHVATLDLAHGLEGYLSTRASRDRTDHGRRRREEQFRCATHIPRALGTGRFIRRYVSRDFSALALQSDIKLYTRASRKEAWTAGTRRVCRPKRLFLLGRSRSHKPSRARRAVL